MAESERRFLGMFSKKEIVVFCLIAFPLWFVKDFSSVKKTVLDYFYRSEVWSGNWSNNSEYMILEQDNPAVGEGIDNYGKVIVRLQSSTNGEVHGDIVSEELCEYQPITWYFFLDSKGPNYFSLGRSRDFELSFLEQGKKHPVAMLRFYIDENSSESDTVVIKPRATAPNLKFPKELGLVKGLPAFDQDVTELNEKCADVSKKVHELIIEHLKKSTQAAPSEAK